MKTNTKSNQFQLEAHDIYLNIPDVKRNESGGLPNLILKRGTLGEMIDLIHEFGDISNFEANNDNEEFPTTIGDDDTPTEKEFIVKYLKALKRTMPAEFYNNYIEVRKLYAKAGY